MTCERVSGARQTFREGKKARWVMSDFSLVRHLLQTSLEFGADVRSMGPTDIVSSEGGLSVAEFDTRLDAMRVWCRSVEKLLLAKNLPDMRIHAGFERLSRLRPVLPRYRALAARATNLTVYGLDDFEPQTMGMQVVHLDRGPLVNEWFVAVKARGFAAVIAADDLDGFGGGVKLSERRFRGLVTHNPRVVASAMQALDQFASARLPVGFRSAATR